jgi:hypothetical protein
MEIAYIFFHVVYTAAKFTAPHVLPMSLLNAKRAMLTFAEYANGVEAFLMHHAFGASSISPTIKTKQAARIYVARIGISAQ